jgi:hypothetical protein
MTEGPDRGIEQKIMMQHRSLAADRFEGDARQRTKLSQRLIDFAEPLTEAVGVGDFDTLNQCMEIAAMCWNAALLAEGGDPTLEARLATIVRSSPPTIRLAIQKLLVDRATRFADDPYMVELLVTKNSSGDASITATGFLSQHGLADLNDDYRRAALRTTASPTRLSVKVGPNEKCTCGSGRKFKKCCKPGAAR